MLLRNEQQMSKKCTARLARFMKTQKPNWYKQQMSSKWAGSALLDLPDIWKHKCQFGISSKWVENEQEVKVGHKSTSQCLTNTLRNIYGPGLWNRDSFNSRASSLSSTSLFVSFYKTHLVDTFFLLLHLVAWGVMANFFC